MRDEVKDIILPSDPIAAKLVTVTGWQSRDGRFYGSDERLARWAGSTHVPCDDCGAPTPTRSYTVCSECRSKREVERYDAMPKDEWDGVQMLFSQSADKYFSDIDEAYEFAVEDLDESEVVDEDNNADRVKWLDTLMLVLCEPNRVRSLDSDHFCEDLPEDGDVPSEVEQAVDIFNEAVKGIVLSWSPGKKRLDTSKVYEAQP